MLIQIIVWVILAIALYSIGFVRGAYKASERNMKAYIELKKRQGISWDGMSKEIMEIFKIRDEL